MAPEWTQIIDRQLPGENSFESLKKLDVYALGIILADLICNPQTSMESMRIDDCLKNKSPSLPKGYKLEGSIEGDILMQLVCPDTKNRPTVETVLSDLLPLWRS